MTIKVTQEAREAAMRAWDHFADDFNGWPDLSQVERDHWIKAFAQFQAQIEAAETERCALYIETHSYTVSNVQGPHMTKSRFAKDDQHHTTLAAAIRKGPAS